MLCLLGSFRCSWPSTSFFLSHPCPPGLLILEPIRYDGLLQFEVWVDFVEVGGCFGLAHFVLVVPIENLNSLCKSGILLLRKHRYFLLLLSLYPLLWLSGTYQVC